MGRFRTILDQHQVNSSLKLTWLWRNTLRKLFVFGHLHFYLQNTKWQKVWQWWHYRFCFSCNPDSRKSNRFWLFSFVWCHDFRHWSRRHFELENLSLNLMKWCPFLWRNSLKITWKRLEKWRSFEEIWFVFVLSFARRRNLAALLDWIFLEFQKMPFSNINVKNCQNCNS